MGHRPIETVMSFVRQEGQEYSLFVFQISCGNTSSESQCEYLEFIFLNDNYIVFRHNHYIS